MDFRRTIPPVPYHRPPPRQQLSAQDLREDPQAFARLLVKMRRRAGLTRAALARGLGIKAASLKQYENGRRGSKGTAGLAWLLRFAAGCGCRISAELPNGKRVDVGLAPASLRESEVGLNVACAAGVDEAKRMYGAEAVPCSTCGASPDSLTWVRFVSPPWTWAKLCGRAGWLTICEVCHLQVDFFREAMN
jgi:transcriptional regulator with XRE-family HTH domain